MLFLCYLSMDSISILYHLISSMMPFSNCWFVYQVSFHLFKVSLWSATVSRPHSHINSGALGLSSLSALLRSTLQRTLYCWITKSWGVLPALESLLVKKLVYLSRSSNCRVILSMFLFINWTFRLLSISESIFCLISSKAFFLWKNVWSS